MVGYKIGIWGERAGMVLESKKLLQKRGKCLIDRLRDKRPVVLDGEGKWLPLLINIIIYIYFPNNVRLILSQLRKQP